MHYSVKYFHDGHMTSCYCFQNTSMIRRCKVCVPALQCLSLTMAQQNPTAMLYNVRYGTVQPLVPDTVSTETRERIVSNEPKLKNSCFRLKYRARWFSSKGAFLILFWNILLTLSAASLSESIQQFSGKWPSGDLVSLFSKSLWAVVAPLAGWIADFYLGTYRMTKIGVWLLLLSTAMNCVLFQLAGHVIEINGTLYVSLYILLDLVSLTGQGIVIVTLMTLGLHQMPDASANNITSFIAWFVCSFEAGYWLSNMALNLAVCVHTVVCDGMRIWSFFPVLAVCIVLISDFFLSSKWLTIEPKSPQSLKNIHQVLKFAVKHKAPLNRSAFTYWEEDIPSRIDLGKSKYGGPFSTDEVEDVKIILRLLVISIPVFLVMQSFFLWDEASFDDENVSVIVFVICNVASVMVLGTIVYESLIYPFISSLLPTILKRIGIGAFLVALVNVTYLGVCIARYVHPDLNWPWLRYPHYVIAGVLKFIWLTSTLELVIAQSPYRMRGLSIGYFWCLVLLTDVLLYRFCHGAFCNVLYGTVSAVFGIVGFVLYCVLAHWYKRRVRGETYYVQTVVEEVYDRYLTVPS